MLSLPFRRARPSDAPSCPSCGRRLRVGSTGRRVAYYYAACNCEAATPTKRARPVDVSTVPHQLRRQYGLPMHDE
jgi:tRNA(Ile2) C34 agmatinyltransferase TiaS